VVGSESKLRAITTRQPLGAKTRDSKTDIGWNVFRLRLAELYPYFFGVGSVLLFQQRTVKKVQPVYPPEAKAARVAGDVKIRLLIAEEGNVIEAEVLEGPDVLRRSALNAVRLWVFIPTELAGMPVKVETILTLRFAPRSKNPR
jgi:TonB family protein